MIKKISQNEFINYFMDSDTYKNNFSYDGLVALYDYLSLEEYNDFEFDLVAICCDFTEYEDIKEVYENYKGYGLSQEELNKIDEDTIREYINDNTILLEFNGGVIIQNF